MSDKFSIADRFRTVWPDRPQPEQPIVHPAFFKEQQAAVDNLKAELGPLIEKAQIEMEKVKKLLPEVAQVLKEYDQAFALGFGAPTNAMLYVDGLRSLGDPVEVFRQCLEQFKSLSVDKVADPLRRFAVLPDLVCDIRNRMRERLGWVYKEQMIRKYIPALREAIAVHIEHFSGQDFEPPQVALPTGRQGHEGPRVLTEKPRS